MTRRRAAVRAAAVACWGLALLPALPSTFGEEASPTLDAAGWWNRSQQVPAEVEQAPSLSPAPLPVTAVTVPPPPSVPEDGLYVASEASGPAAYAAVRYLGSGSDGGSLTLVVAGAATGTEELAACPIPGGFAPAQNGRWESAPAYEESTCTVEGAFAEDGTSVVFDLDAAFVSTLGDIQAAIVPKPGAAPFQVAFEAPTDASLVPSGAAVTSDSGAGSFDPGASFDAGTAGSTTFDAPASSGSFDAPASVPFDAPATDSPDEVAIGGDTTGQPGLVTAPTSAVAENRAARIMAIVVLLAIGGAFWWLASQPERAPRLLGSLGGAMRAAGAPVEAKVTAVRARGVGRFARPRTAPPKPI